MAGGRPTYQQEKKILEEAFLNSLPSKLFLTYLFLLTVRFYLTENVAGRSSGGSYTPNNVDFFFSLFFFGAPQAPAI